eukprot:TRINITY_DN22490_c0_g1_i4.p1 TRINITY_DN22490_c0_g1~~TRINITY_DN22490_c0_g1_i4.p1  ORF type:complete len:695 (+),score=177.50 TRINITY_DN22490_c0_g1_i4:200-2284(+)
MSWYVGKDGQQIWIPRDELVHTVIYPATDLPLENLTYLAVNSKKAVFQEHLVDEDGLDGGTRNSKRRREKTAGRQRGFILRVEHLEEGSRVIPSFKAAASRLLEIGLAWRIDADEAANSKPKQKKKNAATETATYLGVNECRVETTARIHHFAHGPGFRIEVSSGATKQRIHFFTDNKVSIQEWHTAVVESLEASGSHVMLARRLQSQTAAGASNGDGPNDGGENVDASKGAAKANGGAENEEILQVELPTDKAQQDDNNWLLSAMQGCMTVVSDDEEEEEKQAEEAPAEAVASTTPAAVEVAPATAAAPPTAAAKAAARTAAAPAAASEVPEWRRREPAAPQAPSRRGPPQPAPVTRGGRSGDGKSTNSRGGAAATQAPRVSRAPALPKPAPPQGVNAGAALLRQVQGAGAAALRPAALAGVPGHWAAVAAGASATASEASRALASRELRASDDAWEDEESNMRTQQEWTNGNDADLDDATYESWEDALPAPVAPVQTPSWTPQLLAGRTAAASASAPREKVGPKMRTSSPPRARTNERHEAYESSAAGGARDRGRWQSARRHAGGIGYVTNAMPPAAEETWHEASAEDDWSWRDNGWDNHQDAWQSGDASWHHGSKGGGDWWQQEASWSEAPRSSEGQSYYRSQRTWRAAEARSTAPDTEEAGNGGAAAHGAGRSATNAGRRGGRHWYSKRQ